MDTPPIIGEETGRHKLQEEYAATADWPHHVSCAAAVYRLRQGVREYCLLYRGQGFVDADTWHLPGGTLKRHETLEECLAREALEESGVHIRPEGYLGALQREFFDAPSGRQMQKTTHYFLAEALRTGSRHDKEHDLVGWSPLAEALERLAGNGEQAAAVLLRAEAYLALADSRCYSP